MVLADEGSPAFFAGAFDIVACMFRDEPKLTEAFRTGRGVGWHEHDTCLFRGSERFFRTSYAAHLVPEWIPALDGVQAKLDEGDRTRVVVGKGVEVRGDFGGGRGRKKKN